VGSSFFHLRSKGGGYYGFKIHAAVDTASGLPVAWQVETARDREIPVVPVLLYRLAERCWTTVHAVLDKGYDAEGVTPLARPVGSSRHSSPQDAARGGG